MEMIVFDVYLCVHTCISQGSFAFVIPDDRNGLKLYFWFFKNRIWICNFEFHVVLAEWVCLVFH